MDLNNRVVLLTGAKRIGAVVAATVATRGADVAIAYNRSAAEAEEAASKIEAVGRRCLVVQADVSDPEACEKLVKTVDQSFGRIDVLVNMASLYHAVIFDELDVTQWDKQLSIDLRGAFLCAKAVVPVMRKFGG